MKFITTSVLAAAVWAAAAVSGAGAATVSGNLDHPGVAWISQAAQVEGTELEMRNRDRQFIPQLLILHAGSSVRFPNDDAYYHSIYSVTSPDSFDIGYYGPAPAKSFHSQRRASSKCAATLTRACMEPSLSQTVLSRADPSAHSRSPV